MIIKNHENNKSTFVAYDLNFLVSVPSSNLPGMFSRAIRKILSTHLLVIVYRLKNTDLSVLSISTHGLFSHKNNLFHVSSLNVLPR